MHTHTHTCASFSHTNPRYTETADIKQLNLNLWTGGEDSVPDLNKEAELRACGVSMSFIDRSFLRPFPEPAVPCFHNAKQWKTNKQVKIEHWQKDRKTKWVDRRKKVGNKAGSVLMALRRFFALPRSLFPNLGILIPVVVTLVIFFVMNHHSFWYNNQQLHCE